MGETGKPKEKRLFSWQFGEGSANTLSVRELESGRERGREEGEKEKERERPVTEVNHKPELTGISLQSAPRE